MTKNTPAPSTIAELANHARNIRKYALLMGKVQGQGYIGQALGAADLLAVAYFHAMKFLPDDPEWEGRDRFYLSIGHYAIALYATLVEAGILPVSEIDTYGSDDSRLPMSGMASYTPGMEITGGSLGQGLGIAVGACLALKRKNSHSFVYNMLSDGELGEGSTWEAATSASHWKLNNLIAIVDVNNQQADGHSSEVLGFEPLADRWKSFGWYVNRVDGNDVNALRSAFDAARNHPVAQPRVIICDTKMGKGVPFLEQREKTHFMRVEEREWDEAIAIVEQN